MLVRTVGFSGTIGSGKSVRVEHFYRFIKAQKQRSILSSCSYQLSPSAPCVVQTGILNADKIGHQLYAPGAACYDALVHAFGKKILSSSSTNGLPQIDRHELGRIVFSDPNCLAQLNKICRPPMEERILSTHKEMVKNAENQEAEIFIVLLEAALLHNLTRVLHICDDIFLTHCNRNRAIQRVVDRDKLSFDLAKGRVEIQDTSEKIIERLKHEAFRGEVICLDTSEGTLDEGLAAATQHFEAYWVRRVLPLFEER